jgi:hypothetical protein
MLPARLAIPKRSVVVILTAALCFVALSCFKAHQSPLGQGILLLLTPPFLICLVVGVTEPLRNWRIYRFRMLLPLAACVAAWYGAYPVGAFLQSRLFAINLPRFQAIVDSIQRESLPTDGTSQMVPVASADRRQVQHIFAQIAADGALIVEIDTENGFPTEHSGYVFSSSGVFPNDRRFRYRWPYAEEVRPHWFRVMN